MKLRDYQEEAINRVAAKLAQFKRVAMVAPTASGKSIICAGIDRETVFGEKEGRKGIGVMSSGTSFDSK